MKNEQNFNELGENIKFARTQAGFSLPKLARLSGISKGNISKAEHGSNITIDTLYRICAAIGIHPIGVMPAFHDREKSKTKSRKGLIKNWLHRPKYYNSDL